MSAFRHLGRSLLGAQYSPDKEFALATCYLDEAGGKSEGFTVVCGWISTVALWEQFEIDWKLFLAAYKVSYFHMKEFSQSTKEFKGWKGREGTRKRFLADGADIIKDRVQSGILCNVHHTIFGMADRRYELTETLSSPYAIAGRVCSAQSDQSCVEFIFEDGGPDKGGLLKAMGLARKLPDPIFRPSRDMVANDGMIRRGIVQLQAADFLAYEVRKHRREIADKTGRMPRKSLMALLGVRDIAKYSLGLDNVKELTKVDVVPERGLLGRT